MSGSASGSEAGPPKQILVRSDAEARGEAAQTKGDVPVRDAATLIAWRNPDRPEILMGQRGAAAVFMPDKVVFPGGALATEDAEVSLAGTPSDLCMSRLATAHGPAPTAVLAAAIRELWEETGLILGQPETWPAPCDDWAGFAATGHRPDASGLRFVFRAITPPGRPRRFDARFFLVSADRLRGDMGGDGELTNLRWIPLSALREVNLPFITQVVLAELPAWLRHDDSPAAVPFFDGAAEEILMQRLGGRSPLDPD